mgnify:FL=1
MPTKDDTTKDPAAKAAAIALLAKGLITKAEAAELAGVSRQLVQHWARDIPIDKARNAILRKLWRREINRK